MAIAAKSLCRGQRYVMNKADLYLFSEEGQRHSWDSLEEWVMIQINFHMTAGKQNYLVWLQVNWLMLN